MACLAPTGVNDKLYFTRFTLEWRLNLMVLLPDSPQVKINLSGSWTSNAKQKVAPVSFLLSFLFEEIGAKAGREAGVFS